MAGRNGRNGLRTIQRLDAPGPLPNLPNKGGDRDLDLGAISVNESLQHLLPLLTAVGYTSPAAFATSILGMSDAHRRWRGVRIAIRLINLISLITR